MEEELKLIISSPRLYLVNFFDDLKNQIDIEAQIYMDKHKLEAELKEEATQQQVAMINEVDLFQKKCLDCLAAKPIDQFSLDQVQSLEGDLYARKKMLFMNKGLMFLNISDLLDKLEGLSLYIEKNIIDSIRNGNWNFAFGMLVIVEDEYVQYSGKSQLSIGLDKIGSEEISQLLRNRVIQNAIAEQIRNKTIRPVNRIELKINQLDCIGPLHSSVNKGIIKKWLAELVNLKKLTVRHWDFSDPTLFKNSIYLENIFLESSIGTVASNMFACLKNVRDLTIQEGYIKFVPDSLNGLQNLVNLCISAEGLTTIPEGLFKGLNNLTSLELSSNQELDFLPEGLFEGLINLTSLNLGFNSLSTLPEGLFEGLINLEILDLESNSLSTLPEGIFEGLGKLELIKLSGNLIEDITNVAIPPNVRIEMDTNIRRH